MTCRSESTCEKPRALLEARTKHLRDVTNNNGYPCCAFAPPTSRELIECSYLAVSLLSPLLWAPHSITLHRPVAKNNNSDPLCSWRRRSPPGEESLCQPLQHEPTLAKNDMWFKSVRSRPGSVLTYSSSKSSGYRASFWIFCSAGHLNTASSTELPGKLSEALFRWKMTWTVPLFVIRLFHHWISS